MPITVSHFATCWLIYRKSHPDQILLERKFQHPDPQVDGRLCTPGGNWFDKGAEEDKGPLETGCRELVEELTFDRNELPYETPFSGAEVTPGDRDDLETVLSQIFAVSLPFGAFLNSAKGRKYSTLVFYYSAGLDEDAWVKLVRLQEKFRNLSVESLTTITSLDEIVDRGDLSAYGHDRPLQIFFLSGGFEKALEMSLVEGFKTERLTWDLEQVVFKRGYRDIAWHFRPERTPFTD